MHNFLTNLTKAPWWIYILLVLALSFSFDYFHIWDGFVQLTLWSGIIVTACLTHITIVAVTIYLHRNQAHSSLVLHPFVSHFFRLWLWLTTGMVTKEWAAIHRKHHAKVETQDDPHTPRIYGIQKVFFGGVMLYVKETENEETMERYGHGTPKDWIEKNIYTPYKKFGVVLLLFVNVLLFGPLNGVGIWLIQMAWIPFFAAGVINGLGHYFGYRNFQSRMGPSSLSEYARKRNKSIDEMILEENLSYDQKTKLIAQKVLPEEDWSTNILPWGILVGGEELHNNHHAYPTSAKLSAKWFEFDIGWMYIRILESLGLARVKFAYGRTKGPYEE